MAPGTIEDARHRIAEEILTGEYSAVLAIALKGEEVTVLHVGGRVVCLGLAAYAHASLLPQPISDDDDEEDDD